MEIKNVPIESTIKNWGDKSLVRRLWEKDTSLWKSDPAVQEKIQNRLGWLDLPQVMLKKADDLNSFAKDIKKAGFTQAVLLGMGGSSLCPEVCQRTFGTKKGFLKLTVLDSTDPGTIVNVENTIDLEKTLFIVSSKSGGTIEMNSLFRYFFERVKKVLKNKAGKNFIAITDANTILEKTAKKLEFRRVFTTPADVGGRYSALTYFGLVPAALLGVDIKSYMKGIQDLLIKAKKEKIEENAPVYLGIALGVLGRAGRDKVTFIISPEIESFGMWAEQLIAESTGKEERGILPVEGELLEKPEVYGNDRVFVSIRLKKSKGKSTDSKLRDLESAGHPVVYIDLESSMDLAAEFFRWECAVAVSGLILEINPFDEPNVSESKTNTNKILAEYEASGALPDEPTYNENKGIRVWADENLKSSGTTLADIFSAHLSRIRSNDYISLMAYFTQTAPHHRLLQKLRHRLREITHTATTIGYGPRYLHSTGQLHKGGENNGIFIQFTAHDKKDLKIPEAAYGFSTLKMSQALGDFQALKEHERRVIRLDLSSQVDEDLMAIINSLKKIKTTTLSN